MKKILLFMAVVLSTGVVSGTTVTINSTSSFTFSPDSISIHVGDTVRFQVASFHVPIEVSQATWLANANSPITGFSLPAGGGIVTGLTVGVHYYVCQPHASMGMKGRIFVTPATGISTAPVPGNKISIYPNPAIGKFNISYQSATAVNPSSKASGIDIEVYNLLGERVYLVPDMKPQSTTQVDLSFMPAGIYFVKMYDHDKLYVKRVVLQ